MASIWHQYFLTLLIKIMSFTSSKIKIFEHLLIEFQNRTIMIFRKFKTERNFDIGRESNYFIPKN